MIRRHVVGKKSTRHRKGNSFRENAGALRSLLITRGLLFVGRQQYTVIWHSFPARGVLAPWRSRKRCPTTTRRKRHAIFNRLASTKEENCVLLFRPGYVLATSIKLDFVAMDFFRSTLHLAPFPRNTTEPEIGKYINQHTHMCIKESERYTLESRFL